MRKFSIQEYMNRITISYPCSLSPSGNKLAYVCNITGTPQVWMGKIEKSASQLLFPKPITNDKDKSPYTFEDSIHFITDDIIAIAKDAHGNEQSFIEIHDTKNGTFELIPQEKGKDLIDFIGRDKKKIFFNSTRKYLSATGLYQYDLKSKKVEYFFSDKNINSTWAKTKPYKGQHFFTQLISTTACSLKSIHMKTKKVVEVFSDPDSMIVPIEVLSGDRLLVVSSYQRQFMSLAILNLKTKKIDYLQKDSWDVEKVCLSPNQKQMFLVRNVGGKSVLEQYEFPSMKKVPCRFKNDGLIMNLKYSEKNNELIIGFMSANEPKNFYRYNIKTKKYVRMTDTWTSIVPEKELCKPKSVAFKSQGDNVQSWLFLPKMAKNKKCPVIIWPHGGPQVQERLQFRPILQYMISQGFAIWAPNHHGSTGFGKDFANSINRQWGTADLPDMINGIEWLKKSKLIDPKKICIMGGSYGGYMTLRSLTQIRNTFKVGVDIFGPSDLISFVQSVPEDWKPYMDAFVGNAIDDKKMLAEQSPINHLDNIDCPLLVVQGAKDPRVIQKESDQVVEKLKRMGKHVEYLVFEDEGHGFAKINNELKAYETIAEFIKKQINS